MGYLELEDVQVGKWYTCVTYESLNSRLSLEYIGDAVFRGLDGYEMSVYGDIRYVLGECKRPTEA